MNFDRKTFKTVKFSNTKNILVYIYLIYKKDFKADYFHLLNNCYCIKKKN